MNGGGAAFGRFRSSAADRATRRKLPVDRDDYRPIVIGGQTRRRSHGPREKSRRKRRQSFERATRASENPGTVFSSVGFPAVSFHARRCLITVYRFSAAAAQQQ